MTNITPIALTIAGSDSGGGAGIQADIKTFSRFSVFGTSAITAITAQNTKGVSGWEPVSLGMVKAQIDAVFEDLEPAAVKTGMLGSAEVTQTVVTALKEHKPKFLVVDPVMVATSGDILLDESAIATVRNDLIPLADIVTPNLDEVQVLLGRAITSVSEMKQSAQEIVHDMGAHSALIKGGHLPGTVVSDVLYDGREFHIVDNIKLNTTSTHGTGCTLSAAIAACTAKGHSLKESVWKSIHYVHHAIATAPNIGQGNGPLNHLC